MRMKIKKTIRARVRGILVVGILVSSVLIGGIGMISAGKAVERDSARILNLIGNEKRLEIETRLQRVQQSVNIIYQYVEEHLTPEISLLSDKGYVDGFCKEVYEVLKNAGEGTICATSVYLRFAPQLLSPLEGIYLARDTQTGEFKDQKMTDLTQGLQNNSDSVVWYYDPVEAGKAVWVRPYEEENLGSVMASYVIPIYRGGTAVGVIGMDVDLAFLQEIVDGVSVYKTGHAYLITKEGQVYHGIYPDGVKPEEYDEHVKQLAIQAQTDSTEDKVYIHPCVDGEEQMVFKKLINGMYIAVVAPSREINAERYALLWQMILALVIILVIVLIISTRVIRQITKPLSDLTEAARKIGEGNLDVDIQTVLEDETGILAITLKESMQEIKKQVSYANHIAYTDILTGLNNRHYMREYCTKYAQGTPKDVGVIFCDLNRLKYINDTYGHSAGDGLITGFASIITELFPQDMCCRMSGDEFVIIVVDVTSEEFMRQVEVLREHCNQGEIPMAAVGCTWKSEAKRIGEMLNLAEDNMYEEKQKFYEQFPMYRR